MALIKYNRPNADLLSRSFSDFVDEFFNNTPAFRRDAFMPSVDISEDETGFDIQVSLPGMKKKDIKVDLDNSRLTISGERKLEKEDEKKNYYRMETAYGTFSRTFHLPDNVDEKSIKATYEDGILNVSIKKDKDKARKQIEIS